MLELVRRVLVRVLKVSAAPPEVPLGEHPEVFRASPRHLTYLLVAWALRMGLLTLALAGGIGGAAAAIVAEGKQPLIALALVVVTGGYLVGHALVSYAAIRLDYEMRWYVLTDRSLRIREGIVLVREVTLTLANVQELKVSQGPIQRALGLTDLVVDTAGGGGAAAAAQGSVHGHHGVLRGVDRGGDLRQKIEARVKQRRGAGLGDPDEHVHDAADSGDGHDGQGQAARPTSPSAFIDALRGVRDEARRLRALG